MNCRNALCVGLIAPVIAVATTAQAQVYYGPPRVYVAPPVYDGGLPPGEILMRVRAAGLSPLTQPARRGPRYLLLASDYTGGQLRVVVNAYNGRIMRVTPAYDPRFAYQPVRPRGLVPIAPPEHRAAPPARYGAAPPEVKDPPRANGSREPAPRPPASTGSTQDHRLASAPPAADPATPRPARTPLPRPRPRAATASNNAASAPTETAAVPATPAAAPTPAAPPSQPAAAPESKAAPTETKLVPVAPLE